MLLPARGGGEVDVACPPNMWVVRMGLRMGFWRTHEKPPGLACTSSKSAAAADNHQFTALGVMRGQRHRCRLRCTMGRSEGSVSPSTFSRRSNHGGVKVAFGPGIVAPADPLFAAVEQGALHLRSTASRWRQEAICRTKP